MVPPGAVYCDEAAQVESLGRLDPRAGQEPAAHGILK
jgi:hypothetical protein